MVTGLIVGDSRSVPEKASPKNLGLPGEKGRGSRESQGNGMGASEDVGLKGVQVIYQVRGILLRIRRGLLGSYRGKMAGGYSRSGDLPLPRALETAGADSLSTTDRR